MKNYYFKKPFKRTLYGLALIFFPLILKAQQAANSINEFNKLFQSQTAMVNDFKMHYLIAGKGEVLVLLHGWPETSYTWRKLMPSLADKYTLVVPDLRGLGDSGRPDSGYDKKTIAADIHELIIGLGYKKVNIAGHDWGGVVAYTYTAVHPDEVNKLAVIEVGVPDTTFLKLPLIAKQGSLWRFAFNMVQDLPEKLTEGKEREFLTWFYKWGSANPTTFSNADIEEYIRCYAKPGAMKAGFSYYRAIFKDIDNDKQLGVNNLKYLCWLLAPNTDGEWGCIIRCLSRLKMYKVV